MKKESNPKPGGVVRPEPPPPPPKKARHGNTDMCYRCVYSDTNVPPA